VLFGLTFGWGRLRERWPEIKLPSISASAGLAALAIATTFVWRAAFDRPGGLLRLTVLDVGGAGAVLIQSPTGRSVLIDSGPSPVALAEALGRRLPFHDSGIDVFVMSGSPGETCAGLQGLLGRFPVTLALVPMRISGPGCREAEAWLATSGTRFSRASSGMAIDLGGNARLGVLSSSESGLALSLVDHRARFLLPLGADPDSIDSLLRSGEAIQAQVLVAADSGYAAVNPPELFERVRPWLIILAVEADDPRGLPLPEVLTALQGITVLRTDRQGWVELRTDGERLWIEVERPEAQD